MGADRRVRRGHPDFPHVAAVHVKYQEARLPIADGLPKLRDLPKEMGGSGIRMAE